MYTTYSFKELLLEKSNFDDLPEQWLRNRAKLVPYVARAHRFAVDVARACYRDSARAKMCDFKEYTDCRLSALVLRKTELLTPPPGFTFDTVPCVCVAFEPIRKSLGQFTYNYEPRIGLITIRFFLTENAFIKVQGAGDEEWWWLHLKSFSLVNKASGEEKNYYPSSLPAKSFIS